MLTDAKCRNAKATGRPYKLADTGGMYLSVSATGTRVFRYRYERKTPDGRKETTITLGRYVAAPYGEKHEDAQIRRDGGRLTLAEARQARDRAKDLVRQGIDPVQQRLTNKAKASASQTLTVQSLVSEWADRQQWRPSTRKVANVVIEKCIFAYIGEVPASDLQPADVLALLKMLREKHGHHTMKMARRFLWGAMEGATESFLITQNPVLKWKNALPPPPPTKHKSVLSIDQIGQLLRDAQAYKGRVETMNVFRLAWLTLCRGSEAVGAKWSEIDLDRATWRIPAERMKAGREHTSPLPRQAVEMLRAMRTLTGRDEHVFPTQSRQPGAMSTSTLRRMIACLGWSDRFTMHAVRTTGSTILNEKGYRWDVIETQLAHVDPNAVRRTYNHAQYWEERARMMQDWADMLDRWMAGET